MYKLQELFQPKTEPLYRDPFDYMLICQAISNDMKFLTYDSFIESYISKNIFLEALLLQWWKH